MLNSLRPVRMNVSLASMEDARRIGHFYLNKNAGDMTKTIRDT